MTQGLRTRVRIGAAYTGDYGAQQRAVRALPAHARLPGVPRPSRLARAAALVRFAAARAVAAVKGDQP
jgi:hypothetical protein